VHEPLAFELSAHHPGEPGRIDGDLEGLFPVDLDDRDPDPVFELELLVGFDVDLLEFEPEPLALRQDGFPSHVAEVTAGPGVEDDLVHRALGHGAPWHGAMVASGARKMRDGDREDLQLHRRLSAGDRGAFDELYRRYSPTAYGIAYRLTGQQLLAQDVVHDAFLALWRAPEAFDATRGAFRSFFLSLVHHRAVDTIRREERLRARQDRAANLEPAVGEDPSERVVHDDFVARRRSEVRDALADLSAEQRQVLEMAYFAGKTQVRIAEELGIPLGTVKTRTFAALRKLRRALETED
jgi:RNA polymerase sigma factor (sigma-70 family)